MSEGRARFLLITHYSSLITSLPLRHKRCTCGRRGRTVGVFESPANLRGRFQDTMRTSEIYMTDGEVRQEVLREMRWDSRLRGASVEVEVSESEVTLRGTVADASVMLAA